jgi:hypothetical protein
MVCAARLIEIGRGPLVIPGRREAVLLKITMIDFPDLQRWSLQGHLVGEWADELMSTWTKTRHAGDTRRCIVELVEVASIDRNGEAVLSEIMNQGVEFIASDVYTKHVLQNLRSELEQSRMDKKRRSEGDQ